MNEWKEFNETTLPEKAELSSNLNMEDITDADYIHTKRVCKDFQIKNYGEYHGLFPKSDTLLLTDIFENFRKMCLKIYHLNPVKFLLSSWIIMSSSLRKDRGQIRIIN